MSGFSGAIVSTLIPDPSVDEEGIIRSSPLAIGRIERGKSFAGSRPFCSACSTAKTAAVKVKDFSISAAEINRGFIGVQIQVSADLVGQL